MKLFVYGILKAEPNKLQCNVIINATMIDLGPYPAVVKLGGPNKIYGHILNVTEADLERYDAIEGVDKENPRSGLYRREIVNTPLGEAFIYVYNAPIIGPHVECWTYKNKQKYIDNNF